MIRHYIQDLTVVVRRQKSNNSYAYEFVKKEITH